jgi:hypothetical protein
MNRITNSILTIALLLCFFVIIGQCLADGPPPPPPGGGHGGGGNAPPGGGAPIGEGVVLLAIIAVGYGLDRIIKIRCKNLDLANTDSTKIKI